ncbi:hypothetical protein [Haloarcula nitratireducens]|uniref:Uncharacterized protein n=1 Tax=Haloarcula nitratireducens TaxID=2487749 RepID=A0AAW4PA34_9EURY|nr:hypothetical protein [Halomicroarcula nitratireducens]MBX0294596.1 hypothetical protein [Halomicroarcula nitratireducens]
MEIVHWTVFTSLFTVGTLPLIITLTTQFAPIILAGVFFSVLGFSVAAYHEHERGR